MPEVGLPEIVFRWDIPDRLNAAERIHAKAYHIPYAGIVCYIGLLETLDVLKQGESFVHTEFDVPQSTTSKASASGRLGEGLCRITSGIRYSLRARG